jgi:putative transposase
VWHDLLAEGIACGLHRIERLMRQQALRKVATASTAARSGRAQVAAVANVLDRSFEALARNRKWIADFTYVRTAEGWLYVAVVVDLFSRRVVDEYSNDRAVRHRRPGDGIWRRGKLTRRCIIPTAVAQYTSEQFQR